MHLLDWAYGSLGQIATEVEMIRGVFTSLTWFIWLLGVLVLTVVFYGDSK